MNNNDNNQNGINNWQDKFFEDPSTRMDVQSQSNPEPVQVVENVSNVEPSDNVIQSNNVAPTIETNQNVVQQDLGPVIELSSDNDSLNVETESNLNSLNNVNNQVMDDIPKVEFAPEPVNNVNNQPSKNSSSVVGIVLFLVLVAGVTLVLLQSVGLVNLFGSKKVDKSYTPPTVVKEDKKEEESSTEKEEQTPTQEETPQESTTPPVVNDSKERLDALCKGVDAQGNNFKNVDMTETDPYKFFENVEYCMDNICMYSADDYVYSKNCKNGLTATLTVDEAVININLQMACFLRDSTGRYNDNGISCYGGKCYSTVNGRNYVQPCQS